MMYFSIAVQIFIQQLIEYLYSETLQFGKYCETLEVRYCNLTDNDLFRVSKNKKNFLGFPKYKRDYGLI